MPTVDRALREGDLVTCGEAHGKVIEDRGPIGMGGRHLYAVRFEFADDYGSSEWCIELPADMLRKRGQAMAKTKRS